MHVLMEVRVRGALDRRDVGPRDRLRVLRRSRGEEDVRRVLRAARDRIELRGVGKELRPRSVFFARRLYGMIPARQHNGGRAARVDDLLVHLVLLPAAHMRVDREDAGRVGDADPLLEFLGGGRVRDPHDASSREDDPQIYCDRLRNHRHVQREAGAPGDPELLDPVRDPMRETLQLAIRHPARFGGRLGARHDRDVAGVRLETTLCDVHPRARKPHGPVGRRRGLECASRRGLEHDPEPGEHRLPELLTVLDGPSMEVRVPRHAVLRDDPAQVRVPEFRGARDPGGRGPGLRFAALERQLVEVAVHVEVPPPRGVREQGPPQFDPQPHLFHGVRPPRVCFEDRTRAPREVFRRDGGEPDAL